MSGTVSIVLDTANDLMTSMDLLLNTVQRHGGACHMHYSLGEEMKTRRL